MTDHLDQIICGVVLIVVVVALGIGWQTGGDRFQKSVPAAEDITARLLTQQGESAVDAKARFERSDIFSILADLQREKLRIEAAWTVDPSSRTLPGGLLYHLQTLDDLRDGRDLVMRFLPPRDVVAAPGIGVVHLQWRADPGNTVNIVGYVVYRKRADGAFAEVAVLDAETTGWKDKDVQAGVDYLYTVAARTNEEALVADGKALSSQAPPVHITGKVDYEIKPIEYDPSKRALRVSIRKHVDGVWHEREFDVIQGQKVGSRDPGSGVDFSTGCLAQQLQATPEIVVATINEVVLDANGHVVVVEGQPVGRERKTERKGLNVVALLQTRSGRILRIDHKQ